MKHLCLFLVLIHFCPFGNLLCAAEPEANTKSPAGIINDLLRKEFPAASQWDAGIRFRMRSEAKDAGSFPNRDFAKELDNSNDFSLFRTIIHIGWSPAKWLTAFIEGRDAHAISDARILPESDSLDLHQAYIRFGDLENFPLSVQAGRQELIYGDQRFIGNSDWSNLGRSFDSIKVRFQNRDFWLDAFIGSPVLAMVGLPESAPFWMPHDV
jgi:hypothetical protein